MSYFVYLLECNDHSFYIGSTTNVERRVEEHNTSIKGASYTKGRRPAVLRYSEEWDSRSLAQIREAELKKLSHTQKQQLYTRPAL